MTKAAESVGPPQSRLSLFVGFIYLSHALEYYLTTAVIVSINIQTFACDLSSIAAFCVEMIPAPAPPHIGSVAEILSIRRGRGA